MFKKKNKWSNFITGKSGCEVASARLLENLESDFQRYIQYHREAVSPVTEIAICEVMNAIEKLQIHLKEDLEYDDKYKAV